MNVELKDCKTLGEVKEFIQYMLDCGLFDHQDMLEVADRAYQLGIEAGREQTHLSFESAANRELRLENKALKQSRALPVLNEGTIPNSYYMQAPEFTGHVPERRSQPRGCRGFECKGCGGAACPAVMKDK